MAIENISSLAELLPPEILNNFSSLITILKAVGVAFIIYVAYLVVKFVINLKRYKILKRIESRLIKIEDKLGIKENSKKKSKKN